MSHASRLVLSEIREVMRRTVVPVVVPPRVVCTLGQVRLTYDGIAELAVSIAAHGQQVPGEIAMHTRDELVQRLDVFNAVFHTNTRVDDLKSIQLVTGKRSEEFYPVLAAGHRRLLAVKHIKLQCESDPLFVPGPQYAGGYRANLHFGLSPLQVMVLQFQENRHVEVPPIEEVRAAWDFFRFVRHVRPNYSAHDLAIDIGRSNDWVRDALRFCELPESVQSYVDGEDGKPKVSYGRMVEIARLAHGYKELTGCDIGEDALLRWVLDTILDRWSTQTLATRVREFLEHKRAETEGQASLFGDEPSSGKSVKPRKVVSQHYVQSLLAYLGYLQQVRQLMDAGVLVAEDHPLVPDSAGVREGMFSPASPLAMTARILDLLNRMAPQLEKLMHDPALKLDPEHKKMLENMSAVLEGVAHTVGIALTAEKVAAND